MEVQPGDMLRCENCGRNTWHYLVRRCSYASASFDIGESWVLICSACGIDNDRHYELASRIAGYLGLKKIKEG